VVERKPAAKAFIFLLLALIALTTLYPLFFMAQSSIKEKNEYYAAPLALPKSPTLINYRYLFNQFDAVRYAFNSLLIAAIAMAICLLMCIPSAYVFAKFRFRGKTAIYTALIAMMMIPGMVMIIPTYLMYSKFGLMGSYWSPALAYAVGSVPFTVYLATSGFKAIPDEIVEAAKIDGATFPQTLLRLAIPMAKPAIAVAVIFNFVSYWNELLVAMLFLQRDEMKTLTAAVATILRQHNSDYTFFMAGLLVNCIPPIALYLVFQKQLVSGITLGAIK
jgi:raffinose/stachyose/melibiose transport system permease protein